MKFDLLHIAAMLNYELLELTVRNFADCSAVPEDWTKLERALCGADYKIPTLHILRSIAVKSE